MSALVLLGLGWSASLIASSAMLAGVDSGSVRVPLQGATDALMNYAGAGAAAVAGPVLALDGFRGVNLVASVLLVPAVVLAVVAVRRRGPDEEGRGARRRRGRRPARRAPPHPDGRRPPPPATTAVRSRADLSRPARPGRDITKPVVSEYSLTYSRGMAPTSTSGRAAPMAPEQRRAAIVGSTLALIRQHGAQVSTRQIAEAAGVAEGTIFRVFPNKDALICAATDAAFDPGPVVQQIRSVPADQPLEQRLLQVATIMQERLRSVIELLTVLRLGAPPGEGHGHGPERGYGQRAAEAAPGPPGTRTTRPTTRRSSRPSPTSCAPTATS